MGKWPKRFFKKLEPDKLNQLVKEIILGTCIASHGLAKVPQLQSVSDPEIEIYRAEKSADMPKNVMDERIAIATSQHPFPLRHKHFTSASQSKKIKVSGADISVTFDHPKVNPLAKSVKEISYKSEEDEFTFTPETQFLYTSYQNTPEKQFHATPVRSLDGIYPHSYSSHAISMRGHLIEARKLLNQFLTDTILKKFDKNNLSLVDLKIDRIIKNLEQILKSDKELTSLGYEIQQIFKSTHIPFNVQKLLEEINQSLIEVELSDNSALIEHAKYVYQNHLSQPYKETKLDTHKALIRLLRCLFLHQIYIFHIKNAIITHFFRITLRCQ